MGQRYTPQIDSSKGGGRNLSSGVKSAYAVMMPEMMN